MLKFSGIEQIPSGEQQNVHWRHLCSHILDAVEDGLNLNPPYQRVHRWTESQRRAFVEYVLKGGDVSRTLIVNAPNWRRHSYEGATLVDGKQRLAAVMDFMSNQLSVFDGHYHKDFEDPKFLTATMIWKIVTLQEREALDLYIGINAGGTPHTLEEIESVRKMRADIPPEPTMGQMGPASDAPGGLGGVVDALNDLLKSQSR